MPYLQGFLCRGVLLPASGRKDAQGISHFQEKEEPAKTHNIYELGARLQLPAELLGICKRLAPEFIISRYPDALDGIPAEMYDEGISFEIIEMAGRLLKWLRTEMA